MLSFSEARSRVLALAEPLEGIEIALSEAVGLVLAEPLTGDVDLPPFDRAAHDGYAVRAGDAAAGARLRVVGPPAGRSRDRVRARGRSPRGGIGLLDAATTAEIILDPGEAARVTAGAALPVGADAVLPVDDGQAEPGIGGTATATVRVVRGVAPGQGVVPRGTHLRAGTALVAAGTRLRLPMVGLLAAQGCVHPVCHRRVRVAALAVGNHLVGPSDAPVMHRERNATGLTVVAPCLQWGATAHDLGPVAARDFPAALARALTAPVVVVVGEPDAAIRRAWAEAGVEPVFDALAVDPGHCLRYGVVRDGPSGSVHHVFHIAAGPVGVLTAMALLVGPLVARLQGGPAEPAPAVRALWTGPPHEPTADRARAVPVVLRVDPDARLRAAPITHRGDDDLPRFAAAEALALLPAASGPWHAGDLVEVIPLVGWPAAA
jgi:molybdopterin molybdotransferase